MWRQLLSLQRHLCQAVLPKYYKCDLKDQIKARTDLRNISYCIEQKRGLPAEQWREEPQIRHDHSVWPAELEGKRESIKEFSICRSRSIIKHFKSSLIDHLMCQVLKCGTLRTMTKKIGHPVLLQTGKFYDKKICN